MQIVFYIRSMLYSLFDTPSLSNLWIIWSMDEMMVFLILRLKGTVTYLQMASLLKFPPLTLVTPSYFDSRT